MTKKAQAEININRQIKNYFSEMPNILIVFIFGSHVSGQSNFLSDIDIGVLFEKLPTVHETNDLRDNLTGLLKREVDLIALNNASPIIKMQIIKKGTIIFQKYKNGFSDFYGLAVKQYDDLKIIRKKCEDNLLKGRIYA